MSQRTRTSLILAALIASSMGATIGCETEAQACLSIAADVGACLSVIEDMNHDLGPCLSPPFDMGDMGDTGPDAGDMEIDVGPCLEPPLDMGPDAGDMNNSDAGDMNNTDAGDAGDMTGALTPEKHDLLAKLSDRLPPDVLARLKTT